MSKIKTMAAITALAAGAAGSAFAIKKMKEAYQLELENCTNTMMTVYLGTQAAPDALIFDDLRPGEKRHVDLTRLPLTEHDVIYIRFPGTAVQPGYQRTLIYDVDECTSPMHGMIVDYGEGNYDVKLVKRV